MCDISFPERYFTFKISISFDISFSEEYLPSPGDILWKEWTVWPHLNQDFESKRVRIVITVMVFIMGNLLQMLFCHFPYLVINFVRSGFVFASVVFKNTSTNLLSFLWNLKQLQKETEHNSATSFYIKWVNPTIHTSFPFHIGFLDVLQRSLVTTSFCGFTEVS